MPPDPDPPDTTVFISYRRRSWPLARLVERELRDHGLDVFLDVERFLSTGPGNARRARGPDGWAALAEASLADGNAAKAQWQALQGLQLDPENAVCHLVHGVASLELGDAEQARPAVLRAYEYLPDDPRARRARARLATLEDPPDLAAGCSFDPDDPGLRARYVAQLTAATPPDWARAHAVDPDNTTVAAEYALALLETACEARGYGGPTDRQRDEIVLAFEVSPFLNGRTPSHRNAWRFWGLLPHPIGPEPELEWRFARTFLGWFERLRSGARGARLDALLDRLLAIEALPEHVRVELRSAREVAHSRAPRGNSLRAFVAVLLAAVTTAAGLTVGSDFETLDIWIVCLLGGLVGGILAGAAVSPEAISSLRRRWAAR